MTEGTPCPFCATPTDENSAGFFECAACGALGCEWCRVDHLCADCEMDRWCEDDWNEPDDEDDELITEGDDR